jgi:pimeloyl-ACP methyl ester carboxylesterase
MHVELVRTVTRDGLRLDGALSLPSPHVGEEPGVRGQSPEPRTLNSEPSAAILLHGVAGNFYTSSTFDAVIPALMQHGLAVLSINTRGHDSVFGASLGNIRRRFGAAYEVVDDCRQDIAAWIAFLASRGHERVVLIGHSLGAIKALYAQAHERWPQVAAVIAASPPRLSYAAFMIAAESSSFFESFSTAEGLVQEGRGDELFSSKFPFPLLITASAYIDKYGPAERYNILRFAGDLTCPALFTYGSKELEHGGIAFAGLPDALMSLPGAEQRQVVAIDGADHLYTGLGERLAAEITAWLARRWRGTTAGI